MARRSGRGKPTSRQPSAAMPGRLRIVAGKWRSRVLDVTGGDGLRPTPERVRETLFNWLAPRIHGARCLDLFAGTGALGFEALSRGARYVRFVESAPAAVRALESNARLLDAEGADIRRADAWQMLERTMDEHFDVVFLDPPFAEDRSAELCRLVNDAGLLAPGALVYLEEPRDRPEAALPEGWAVEKQKTAGKVRYQLLTPAG